MTLPSSLNVSELLGRLRAKSQDPQSILRMAFLVAKTNVGAQLLLMISSIVLIRYVSKAEYGLWRMLASTTAFIPLLFAGMDQAIHRFVPVESRRNADAVTLSAFAVKASVTVVGLGVLALLYPQIPDWLNVPTSMRRQFAPLFWVMLGSTAVVPVATTLFAVTSAHKQFELVFKITMVKQSLMLVCVFLVVELQLTLVHYVASELALSVLQVMILWRAIRPLAVERGGDLLGALIARDRVSLLYHGWRVFLKSYAVPLNVASALSYIRGHVPVMLLGSLFSLQSAAVYSIFKNVLTTIHKTEGGILSGVMPRVFQLYESDRNTFLPKFTHWTGRIYALRFAVGVSVILGAPLWFWVYKIEPSSQLTMVLVVLVLEFLMSEVVNVSNMAVMMSRRTTSLMLSAGVRFVFEVPLLIFVTRRYGMIGAAVTLFLARSAQAMVTVHAAKQVAAMRQQYAVGGLLMAIFAVVLVGMLAVGS